MNRVFDTVFEMSLRIIILLSVGGKTAKTADMIALTDTIAIYGSEFGIVETNLHGSIDYVLDEYDTRRELIKSALKDLVLRGLVLLKESHDGFSYSANESGKTLARKLESDYAVEYRVSARAANRVTSGRSEQDVFDMIRTVCEKSLEGRRGNV